MILNGVFRVNREPLSKLYPQDPNFCHIILKATLPRERFKTILRFLRFDTYETRLVRVSSNQGVARIFDGGAGASEASFIWGSGACPQRKC